MTSLLSPAARKLMIAGVLALTVAPPASALDLRSRLQLDGAPDEFVWISPSNGNWSNGANWLGGTAPPAGGGAGLVLRFTDAGASGFFRAANDLPGVFDLAGLVLDFHRGAGESFIATAPGAGPLRMAAGGFIEQRGPGRVGRPPASNWPARSRCAARGMA